MLRCQLRSQVSSRPLAIVKHGEQIHTMLLTDSQAAAAQRRQEGDAGPACSAGDLSSVLQPMHVLCRRHRIRIASEMHN